MQHFAGRLVRNSTAREIVGVVSRGGWLTVVALVSALFLFGCSAPTTESVPENAPQAALLVEPAERGEVSTVSDSVIAVVSPAEFVEERAAPAIIETEASGEPAISSITGPDALMIVAAQEQVINNIYHKVLPSVVLIRVTKNLGGTGARPELPDIPNLPFRDLPPLPNEFYQRSGGSGFFWDNEGHIVTNHHVIDGADRVIVMLENGTEMEAEVLGSDPDSDLAVLEIQGIDGPMPPAAALGDSDAVLVGQLAAALGNPFGQQFSITSGIISGVGRTIRSGNSPFSIPEVLQTDAPINPGNSGGPLLDRNGQVIGVNTQIISRSGSSSGIGFAVPINIAKQVIPALLEEGEFHYSWLGISGSDLSPDVAEMMDLSRETRGALLIDIVNESPADDAGLQGSDRTQSLEGIDRPLGGDIIVSIDGRPVEGIDDIIAYLVGHTRPGQEITLEVLREESREEVQVTLGTRPGSL